ncbi:MAG: ArsR/SmtB family transcription factor [Acidimicrobiia bacterium]
MTEPHPDVAAGSEAHALDYELEDFVVVESKAQMKAVADDTRMDILNLLLEKAATVSQLADALGKPKGTVGYHAKVLEDAGLITMVRTAKVRAMTEKYYGRTGRTIHFSTNPDLSHPSWVVTDALRSLRATEGEQLMMFTSRVARIPVERAVEFADRLVALAEEFIATPRSGDTTFGYVAGVFPTDHPAFGDEDGRDD